VTITHSKGSRKFADNWSKIFGGRKGAAAESPSRANKKSKGSGGTTVKGTASAKKKASKKKIAGARSSKKN
jgi:hypothetical protein